MQAPPIADLELRDLPTVTTAAVRVWRTFQDLGGAFPEFLPKIAARITQLGGEIAGPPYARYHMTHEGNVDVEIGAPIAAAIAGLLPLGEVERGEVGESGLPEGRAAVMTHVGPYPTLGAAWQLVDKLLADGQLEAAGPGWESYVDDPGLVPPDRLRTEIVTPIR